MQTVQVLDGCTYGPCALQANRPCCTTAYHTLVQKHFDHRLHLSLDIKVTESGSCNHLKLALLYQDLAEVCG